MERLRIIAPSPAVAARIATVPTCAATRFAATDAIGGTPRG